MLQIFMMSEQWFSCWGSSENALKLIKKQAKNNLIKYSKERIDKRETFFGELGEAYAHEPS